MTEYDLFKESRKEMALDIEQAQRRRRLYQKFGKDKKSKVIAENTWSVEDHRDFLMCGYSDKQKRFCILPRLVVTSPAFWHLRNASVKALIMAYNATVWNKPKKVAIRARAGGKGLRKVEMPPSPQPFSLPIARLEAVGLSRPTAIKALQELSHLGFIEVMGEEAGKPTLYKVSSEYLRWPSEMLGGKKILPPRKRETAFSAVCDLRKLSTVAI